jgi:hypothetical protein
MPHRRFGDAREQLHQSSVIRRLDGEDIDECDSLASFETVVTVIFLTVCVRGYRIPSP